MRPSVCQHGSLRERETLLNFTYGIPIRQRRYAQISCSSHGTGIDFYLPYHIHFLEIDTGYKAGKRALKLRYWNDTANKAAENQAPVEIEAEKTNDEGQKAPRKIPHSALDFMRPKGPRYTFSAYMNRQQWRLLVESEVPKV